jgi:hypothetical protein
MSELLVHGLNRRNFGFMAASAFGLSVFPLIALASGTAEALGLSCIDYRLVGATVTFFDGRMHLRDEYDQLALAGAALGAMSPQFPSSNAAFWDHVEIAKDMHHIKKVIVLDHRDCGAYKVAFGKDFAVAHDAETAQHKAVMMRLKTAMGHKQPALGLEFYLMALDGTVEKII